MARYLSHTFSASKKNSDIFKLTRDEADIIQKEYLTNNPYLLGVWTLWEPNAFDGSDVKHINKGHSDSTGRYIPYWTIDKDNNLNVSPLVDYNSEGPASDYYNLCKKSRSEVILDPFIYKVHGKDVLMTSLVVPIIIEGQFLGVTGVDISLDYFQSYVENLSIFKNQGQAIIFSHIGTVAAHSLNAKNIGKKFNELIIDNYTHLDSQRFKQKDSIKIDKDNFSILSYISSGNTQTPWYIEILVPQKVIQQEIYSNIIKVILWGAFITVILTIVGVILINRLNAKLIHISNLLKNEAQHNINTAKDMSIAAQKLSNSTSTQAESVHQSSSSINEISSIAQRNAQTAESTLSLSRKSQADAQAGIDSLVKVENTIYQINESNNLIINSVEKNNKDVQDIISIIQEISEKTKVINDIVFQTKLLSFNASVEAARAGENGKGFSVVAQEVAALANMSGQAASEISQLLDRSISQVTSTIESSSKTLDESVSQSEIKIHESQDEMKKCRQILDDVMASFKSVNSAVQDMTLTAQEQTKGVLEIHQAIDKINTLTSENSSIVKSTTVKVDELKLQSKKFNDIVRDIHVIVHGKKDSTH